MLKLEINIQKEALIASHLAIRASNS